MKGLLCFIKPAQYNVPCGFCVSILLEAHIAVDEIVLAVRQLQHWKTSKVLNVNLTTCCVWFCLGLWHIVCQPINMFRKPPIVRLYGPDYPEPDSLI